MIAKKIFKKIAVFILLLLYCIPIISQRHEILDKDIATLQVVAGQDWQSIPVAILGSQDGKGVIYIDFDDLTHTYRRFTYQIEHCEADWTTPSDLFTSDYLSGFSSGNTIADSEASINTNILYTHYSLKIPNDDCKITMSGNYKLRVFDNDNNDEPVLIACFMVSEQKMDMSMEVLSNTDIDINNSHQQVSMKLSYGSLMVTDPDQQIKTVLMQNGRWDNAKINIRPQYIMADGLRWEHCKDYIFLAGNEYHKYEILDVTHPTMGIDHISWDGEDYHVYPYTAEPRPNYTYDVDADGAFYIRNSDNQENDITSEYVYVHYKLKCPEQVKGDVYINGAWTYDMFTPKYKMEYDSEDKSYTAVIMQKQGYYSYQFLMLDSYGVASIMPTEGNYYQTQNTYYALVYYRGRGERADRLVGFRQIKTNF